MNEQALIQTQCPECQRINSVKAQDPRTIRPGLQCAACLACNRVYNVQTHLAPVTCASCHQVIVAEEGDTCASIPAWQRGRFDYCDTAATAEQTYLDREIGPRVVGGTYYNGYWGDTYTVEEICRDSDGRHWAMRVRWSDGHATVHSTGWDARRDRVVATATVPDRAPAGMLAVRVGSDPWTMVPLDHEQDTSAEGARTMAQHFIAISGTHGCIPDYCTRHDTAEAAAEALGYIHELGPRNVRRLGNTGYLELDGPETGAEYAEIIGCNCDSPSDHDD